MRLREQCLGQLHTPIRCKQQRVLRDSQKPGASRRSQCDCQAPAAEQSLPEKSHRNELYSNRWWGHPTSPDFGWYHKTITCIWRWACQESQRKTTRNLLYERCSNRWIRGRVLRDVQPQETWKYLRIKVWHCRFKRGKGASQRSC